MTRSVSAKKNTAAFRFEKELCAPICRYFEERDFFLQDTEVQFFEYRMDIYCYSERQGKTVAVELKLKEWGKAIKQALLYQLCSDLVYIAMPSSEIQRVDHEQLRDHGLGLISVHGAGECHEVVPARPSAVMRSYYRDDYVDCLSESGVNGVHQAADNPPTR